MGTAVGARPGASELVLVRHGESLGNVAREGAEADGADRIPLEWRDADTPLSELGRAQARAAGAALAALAPEQQPGMIWTSPYVRALDTAAAAATALGIEPIVDERLRDRELGVLDGFTSHGVRRHFADEAARRRALGKLYYRPPGGESWADVALRIRSLLHDLDRAAESLQRPVLLVSHDAVVVLVRYVLERLSESVLLELAASDSVPNASITRLVRTRGNDWRTVDYGTVDHLEAFGIQPTVHGTDHEPHEH